MVERKKKFAAFLRSVLFCCCSFEGVAFVAMDKDFLRRNEGILLTNRESVVYCFPHLTNNDIVSAAFIWQSSKRERIILRPPHSQLSH